MSIPTTGLVNSYDPLNPASYNPAIPSIMLDTVGSCHLNLANLTYNSTNGSLTSTTILTDYGRSNLGTYPPLNLNTTWSASIWVKQNASVDQTIIFGMGGATIGTGGGTGYVAWLDGNGTTFTHTTSDVVGETFSFSWNTSNWYNFTFTYDGSTNPSIPVLKVYANGTLIRTVNWNIRNFSLNSSQSNLAYDGWFTGTLPGFLPTQGNSISKGPLKIWNVTLNSTQVNDVYLNDVGRFSPPLHEYDFSDPASYSGSGFTVNDIGSSPINLTLANATYNTNQNIDTFKLAGSLSSYIRSAQPVSIGIGTNNFSYQMWYQFNGQTGLTGPVDCQLQVGSRGAGTYGGCNITTVSGQLVIESPGVGQQFTGFYPVAGKWYLISLTVDGSNSNKLYVNGSLVYTVTQSYNPLGALASIAMGPAVTNLGDASLSGYGALQIYDRVISATEITDYYDATKSRFNAAVHVYDAIEPSSYPGSGSTFTDIGIANTPINLTINSATFNNVNETFDLDGTLSSYIRSASGLSGFDIGANDFTVQYWFKLNATTAQPPYNIHLQMGSRGGTFSGFTNFTFNNEFIIGKPGVADYATGWVPTFDTWYQVTMTVNSSNLVTLYVDGVSTYTQTISFVTPAFILSMGANGVQTDQVADASMGPLYIFDRVLTGTEITDYYTNTVSRFAPAPPYAGLVGGRTFGQGFAG